MLNKNKIRNLLILGYVAVLLIAFVVIKSDTTTGVTTSEVYKQQVRNGLAEANVPKSANPGEIEAGVNSLSDFVYNRSGVQLSFVNKNHLRTTEQNFSTDSRKVRSKVLAQIISKIAVEQIPQLSDAQIASITDSFRGFYAPGVPAAYAQSRNYTAMRASGRGRLPVEQFKKEFTDLRNGGIESRLAQSMIYVAVYDEVETKMRAITDADPQFFGPDSTMTPMQAVLVTYAVVTDDGLANDQTTLNQKLQTFHQSLQQVSGHNFPSPQGHKAFGDNGYFFSSPASFLLSEANINRLIGLIQERGDWQ